MSGQGEGVLASRGTRSTFVFLGVIVFSVGILEDKGGEGLFAYIKSGSHRSRGWFVTMGAISYTMISIAT